jgi:hypothetical protein
VLPHDLFLRHKIEVLGGISQTQKCQAFSHQSIYKEMMMMTMTMIMMTVDTLLSFLPSLPSLLLLHSSSCSPPQPPP